jgi:hypothetical protein
MLKYTLLILIVLMAALLACELPPLVTGQPAQSSVLFQDDFSDPASGWSKASTLDGETNYTGGAYHIRVGRPDSDIPAFPGLNFGDVRVEVETAKAAGPDDNRFGLLCRVQDASHFYFFIISSDGYYAIGKAGDDPQEKAGMLAMQPSELIAQGMAANHMRADCVGDLLTLYVNGQKLGQLKDSQYTSGDVGMIAGTYKTPGVDVYFDHFSVLRP